MDDLSRGNRADEYNQRDPSGVSDLRDPSVGNRAEGSERMDPSERIREEGYERKGSELKDPSGGI